jgi:muramidase (phage lysozyme)
MLGGVAVQIGPAGKKVAAAGRHRGLARLAALEKRLEHVEAMVEGLQDAVHRESVRQEREIDDLQKKMEPGEIRRALSQDAREHGI